MDALGNAGTQAAGLWQFLQTGAMSKHLHAGRAAEAGVVSGELAALGFTGAPEILDGEKGFFAGLAPEGDPAKVLADADAPWQLHLTSIKPWPSCRHTHPAIDAAQEIDAGLKTRGASEADIEGVDIFSYQAALNLCDRANPESVYEAKFSLQHTVAAALLGLALDFSAFDDEARGETALLRQRMTVRVDRDLEAAYPAHWGARVAVRLVGGAEITAARRYARGDPELPMSHAEIVEKARVLIKGHDDHANDAFIEAVLALPRGGPLPRLELGAAAQFV
jgi:2-methylcitrate dehydratase PrpD